MSLLSLTFFFFALMFSLVSSTPTLQPLHATHKYYTFLNPKLPPKTLTTSKKFEGSSELVNLRYHMGPVLSSPINIYLIWYGKWTPNQTLLIKDFLLSISTTTNLGREPPHPTVSTTNRGREPPHPTTNRGREPPHPTTTTNHGREPPHPTTTTTTDHGREPPHPTVSDWWQTVSLYTDQTNATISRSILIAGEYSDHKYTHGTHLTRLTIQEVIASSVVSAPFPVDHKNGIYLVLTSGDVTVEDFCRAVCGFHYFTFASKVGYTLPYAWVGNSGKQCPEVCAYPFAIPAYMAGGGPVALGPPNDDVGVDGMISVIGHELAELASNPLINAWYAGEDPTAPTEIGDLCEGLYGSGGGGGYIGEVMKDGSGRSFNMNGRNGRRFLVQWIWSPELKACVGPNAKD